jgi:NADH-quinone oxidoreductase subunit B
VAQNSVKFIQAGLACCGVEAAAIDLVKDAGATISSEDQSANILVVAGTVTKALSAEVLKAYENLTEPKVVVAFGVCAITGGPYWDSYSVLPGANELIPVDINVPGCPPSPHDLAAALNKASGMVESNA